MVCPNQRSIYESIQKVVGSSNRGFISLDPERQPRITTQAARPAAVTPMSRPAPAASATHDRR